MTLDYLAPFRVLARHGRYTLALGLIAGLLLPNVAEVLKPWVAHLVLVLLFLTAFRIGHRKAFQGLRQAKATIRTVLAFQLGLPLCALAVFSVFGVSQSPYALAVVLVFAAPALTGSPNLSIMVGADPEPAFRLLILGTAVLPATMLPVFWLSPQMGDLAMALWGAIRLLGAIGLAVAIGFFARILSGPQNDPNQTEALDGVMALALVIMVVALMGALGPAILQSPLVALRWMALAFAINLGAQLATLGFLKLSGSRSQSAPVSIVAGNRNVALFLVTMPTHMAEPLLIFLACYQVPMYLTPILMKRFYRS